MRDFTKLEVWQRAVDHAAEIRNLARSFPYRERWVLTIQLLKAADSVAANIAEGSARGNNGDLERHLRIAAGSAAEVQTLLVLATRAEYLQHDHPIVNEISRTRRMLNAFISKVRADRRRSAAAKSQRPKANGRRASK